MLRKESVASLRLHETKRRHSCQGPSQQTHERLDLVVQQHDGATEAHVRLLYDLDAIFYQSKKKPQSGWEGPGEATRGRSRL
jgi:hypothetical protein